MEGLEGQSSVFLHGWEKDLRDDKQEFMPKKKMELRWAFHQMFNT